MRDGSSGVLCGCCRRRRWRFRKLVRAKIAHLSSSLFLVAPCCLFPSVSHLSFSSFSLSLSCYAVDARFKKKKKKKGGCTSQTQLVRMSSMQGTPSCAASREKRNDRRNTWYCIETCVCVCACVISVGSGRSRALHLPVLLFSLSLSLKFDVSFSIHSIRSFLLLLLFFFFSPYSKYRYHGDRRGDCDSLVI